jgi:hypothetical protein
VLHIEYVSPEPAATVGSELDRLRIERSLKSRKRYRYVRPKVLAVEGGYRIESPCCSRNIGPEGGIIDIALIRTLPGAAPWLLYRKDHGTQGWVLHERYTRLVDLLAVLNVDSERLFWQ